MSQIHLNSIRQLVDHIETHLDAEINVLDVSKDLGLSPWHFQRLFKSLVGDSLGSYIRGRRLTRAAELLKKDGKSIIDIAMEVGFNSHEAFSRSFKAHFNYSPKEFRAEKPHFLIQKKPILSDELLHFLSTRITTTPIITEFPEVKIQGFTIDIPSPFMDPIHCTTIAEPWMALMEIMLPSPDILNYEFFGVTLSESGNFTEENLKYLASVDTSRIHAPFANSFDLVLPKQKVALFSISTNVQDDSLKQKVDSIYGYWLLNSDFERNNGHDFEYFKNMRNPMVGDFDAYYAVPIK